MNITIIGAGSIGLLFAYYLSKADHHVQVVTKTNEQMKLLEQLGLTLIRKDFKETIKVNTVTISEYEVGEKWQSDLVIIAVKQTQLHSLENLLLQNKDNYKNILFVQNGMGHLPFIETLHHPSIMLGVVEHGALKENQHTVNHTGVGKTKIASYPTTRPIASFSSEDNEHFLVELYTYWYEMLAEKLVVNAVINPLTALFNVKNGELLKSEHFLYTMRCLFNEAVAILELRNSESLWELVIDVCSKTANNTSSMLRDIQTKQETEIDAINGFLVQKAKKEGKPVYYTEFVYNSIKGITSRGN